MNTEHIAYNNAIEHIEDALAELNDWGMEEYGVWSQTPYKITDIVDVLNNYQKVNASIVENGINVDGVIVYMEEKNGQTKEYGIWIPIPYLELDK